MRGLPPTLLAQSRDQGWDNHYSTHLHKTTLLKTTLDCTV